LFDHVRAQWLTALIGSMAGAAFVVLATLGSPLAVIVAAVFIGIGFGAEGDALSYMTSRAFGMRNFGTIFGFMFLAFSTGGSLGPVVFALLKAHSGNYQSALWLGAGACALATFLVTRIKDSDLLFTRRLSRNTVSVTSALTQNA
jgi:MFS transporter, OFA family, oxalate/formate antiporter